MTLIHSSSKREASKHHMQATAAALMSRVKKTNILTSAPEDVLAAHKVLLKFLKLFLGNDKSNKHVNEFGTLFFFLCVFFSLSLSLSPSHTHTHTHHERYRVLCSNERFVPPCCGTLTVRVRKELLSHAQ